MKICFTEFAWRSLSCNCKHIRLFQVITFTNISNYSFFRSVTQSCPTLCDAMNHSMPGLPVHHQLPEFTKIHVH